MSEQVASGGCSVVCSVCGSVRGSVLQCIAASYIVCSVLQCATVRCGVLFG